MYCVVLIVRYTTFLLLGLFYLCCWFCCTSFIGQLSMYILWLHRSIVVSAGLLRVFGREVAELPLVATSREHQGKV